MIAKNLKHLRHLKKLTQEILAEDLGVTRSRISSYEEGRSAPTLDFLITVSDYFKIPIDTLLRKNLTLKESASLINYEN
ncbi:helix-turn-helix domain-containing protein [Formosa sp. 3Alg 14/1]|uniref:helix-turn-helix domain-containing protein n=1 Tax=Formosa sp. 3Alg 14/1 TaxID=3382190 RepID=UPI0039BE4A87